MMVDHAERVPTLLLTEGGPGNALLRRLKLAPLGQGSRRDRIYATSKTTRP
jgi:hypothetical protein